MEDGACKVTAKQLVECRKTALELIDSLMLTDVPLVRPPGQIALCALRRAAGTSRRPRRYCESVGSRGTTPAPKGSALKDILDEIESHVEEGVEPEEAVVKEIDKKLKLFRSKYKRPPPRTTRANRRRAGASPSDARANSLTRT